jgi:hypothetical protein
MLHSKTLSQEKKGVCLCVCVCVYHIEYIVQKWSYKNAKKFFQNKE